MTSTNDLTALFEGVANYETPERLAGDYQDAQGFDEAGTTPSIITASSPECLTFSASVVSSSVGGTLAVSC